MVCLSVVLGPDLWCLVHRMLGGLVGAGGVGGQGPYHIVLSMVGHCKSACGSAL